MSEDSKFPYDEVIDGIAESFIKYLQIKEYFRARVMNQYFAKEQAWESGWISDKYEFGKIYKVNNGELSELEECIIKIETALAFAGPGWDTIGLNPHVYGATILVAREKSDDSFWRMEELKSEHIHNHIDERDRLYGDGWDKYRDDIGRNFQSCPLYCLYPNYDRLKFPPIVITMFDFPDDAETLKIAEFFRDRLDVTVLY